jgi:uncharacterized phage protein (TIGR01671 family)
MREIKFRARDEKTGEWRYGSLILCEDDLHSTIIDEEAEYGVLTDTVGQYVGLKDKNGKEIYEGDIVRWKSDGMVAEVSWDADKSRFRWAHWTLTKIQTKDLSVIGNVYENPELLK